MTEDGSEIEWPVPFWWIDIGATMQNIMLAAVNEGLGCGFVGPEIEPLREYLGIPEEFVPIGVMPVGRPLPDVRSPSLKRGLGAVRPVCPLGGVGGRVSASVPDPVTRVRRRHADGQSRASQSGASAAALPFAK